METELKNLSEKLEAELEGYVSNESIEQEVLQELEKNQEHIYRRQKLKELEKLRQEIETESDERAEARNHFNKAYPAYGFTGVEHGNEVYDKAVSYTHLDVYKRQRNIRRTKLYFPERLHWRWELRFKISRKGRQWHFPL